MKTLCDNGQVPGPLLRVKEGRPLTVDVAVLELSDRTH